MYIYTSVHVYIAYDARTVAFIFGRERERGRGGGSGFGGFELCLSGARARLCVRACVCTVCHEEEDELRDRRHTRFDTRTRKPGRCIRGRFLHARRGGEGRVSGFVAFIIRHSVRRLNLGQCGKKATHELGELAARQSGGREREREEGRRERKKEASWRCVYLCVRVSLCTRARVYASAAEPCGASISFSFSSSFFSSSSSSFARSYASPRIFSRPSIFFPEDRPPRRLFAFAWNRGGEIFGKSGRERGKNRGEGAKRGKKERTIKRERASKCQKARLKLSNLRSRGRKRGRRR